MGYSAGIDVSLEQSSVCVVDGDGRIMRESKVASEPAALIGWFGSLGLELTRVGLEAGPLSQWLYAAMNDGGGCRSNCWRRGMSAMPSRRCRSRPTARACPGAGRGRAGSRS
jgi:hypothetical protein